MLNKNSARRRLMLGAMALGFACATAAITPATLHAQQVRAGAPSSSNDMLLSVGRGRLITLPVPMTDIFVANQAVADVQVRSSTQLYVFGKTPGETSIYATDGAGRVVYSVVARVGNNIETIDQMLTLAMPDASVNVNTMNGLVLLTGTVAAPEDAAEAERLVSAFVGEGTRVLSRLQTATPLQVNLQVRIAEVNRSVVRQIGGNLQATDVNGSGITFGAASGRTIIDADTGALSRLADTSTLALGGRLLGLDLLGTLDLAERSGLVATLAQPNLTTISGETADFLAGGEYPIPVPDPSTGTITIQYRKFGVSLAYAPTVLSNGRISLRVRPEVSELSTEGAISLNGISVPALSIRRAETTVELGSGESFMIAGLMSNRSITTLNRAPGLGDIPILGALFRSDEFRRGDTELVIVVTPYLVRPVSADRIALPTDSLRSPTIGQRLMNNALTDGENGVARPAPTLEQGATHNGTVAPGMSASAAAPATRERRSAENAAAQPGFSFNP